MPAVATLHTTLNGDVLKDDRTITLTATTSLLADDTLILGREFIRILSVDTTANTVEVRRGVDGTASVKHLDGAAAYAGRTTEFTHAAGRAARAGYSGSLGVDVKMAYPVGSESVDPSTGYVYCLVDCQKSMTIGEWVTIDGNGLASQMIAGAIGRVGVIIDTITASDELAWALVAGSFDNVVLSSDVTSATVLACSTSATGYPSFLDSNTDEIIHNARATAVLATSVGTSPLVTGIGGNTVFLDHPWVTGNAEVGFIS